MRVFWFFILAIVLLGAVSLALRGGGSPAAPAITMPQTIPPSPVTEESKPAIASARPTDPPSPTRPSASADVAALHADLSTALDAVLQTGDPAPKSAAQGSSIDLPANAAHPIDQLIKADARRLPDGSLRLDDQFILAGSGTKADPYVVDFPLLMSAENTYQPRKGLKKLPQRVAFLHDAWIKITGYTAFPIATTEPTEMLVMFNQWDGCCIGTPPTAYDAIEVKLAAPANGESRFAIHGTVVGQFKVDPYIDSNYLLGLYVMDNASFTSDKTDANMRQQHNQP